MSSFRLDLFCLLEKKPGFLEIAMFGEGYFLYFFLCNRIFTAHASSFQEQYRTEVS